MTWYVMKNGIYSWISTAGKQPLKTDATVIKSSVCCKEKKNSIDSSELHAISTRSA